MLSHVTDRDAVSKKIAIITSCDDFTDFLKRLLHLWGFEIIERPGEGVLLLAENGYADPGKEQDTVWLTRSKYQGTDRISVPLEIEGFWQLLEHRYHRPPRMHIRLAVDMEGTVSIDGETFTVRLSSLSDMGCRFSYNRELVRDQQVALSLSFSEEEFRIDSRVIYAHHLTAVSDNEVRVGLLFQGVGKDQRERLRSCLILRYLQKVENEMDAFRFRNALEKLELNDYVRARLEV